MLKKLEICSNNYKTWKEIALKSKDPRMIKKAAEKAFFWIELQTSFLVLNELEKNLITESERKKLLNMKLNLMKKLLSYAKKVAEEL